MAHAGLTGPGIPFDLCLDADDPRATVMGVMLDCPDAKALSAFNGELLGKPITYEAGGMAMIGDDGGHPLLFQQVEACTPPRWPDPAHPQQLHLDVRADDIDSAEQAALAISAAPLPGHGENWRVYADPAGKPFCLVWDAGEGTSPQRQPATPEPQQTGVSTSLGSADSRMRG